MSFKIKKLDWLLIKSFLGPFAITSVLVIFTFLMQFYWLYMDDLIGKGLGIGMMLQLLIYMIPNVVPLALPLIVMLSSIMTMGALGESYELVAIKSSGISLFRFIRPLFVFILLVAVGAYYFNNNVLPVANLKAYSLLYDMRNQKPTSSFAEGVFNNDYKGYSIRINKKHKDGKNIEGILIYDHTQGNGNKNVVMAKKGKMYRSPSGKNLVFELEDGWRHEEKQKRDADELTRMHFKKWFLTFDLSQFDFERTNEEDFKGREEMMNLQQLSAAVDSFQSKDKRNKESIFNNVRPYITLYKNQGPDTLIDSKITDSKTPVITFKSSLAEAMDDSLRKIAVQNAISSARNIERSIGVILYDVDYNKEKVNKAQIAINNKFTLSIACIILFFIGAPLGAIIRKGGLGMPVLVAIIFFLIYYSLNTTGEKLAEQQRFLPWQGMWLANVVLIPIAVFIMIKARNDSNLFNKELYLRLWTAIKKLIPFTKKKEKSLKRY